VTSYRRVDKVCVVSDIHLGFINKSQERAFLDFITNHLPADLDELILLGDIIDPWVTDDQTILTSFYEPFRKLERLECRKVYVIGNHDYTATKYIGKYLPDLEVVEYHVCMIGGKICMFVHGHQYDQLFKWIPPRFTAPILSVIPDIQRAITQKSVRYTFTRWIWDNCLKSFFKNPKYKTIEELVWEDFYRFIPLPNGDYADINIFGHTHVPQLSSPQDKFIWGNTGSWVGDAEEPNSAIFISSDGPKIAFYEWNSEEKKLVEIDRVDQYDSKEGK